MREGLLGLLRGMAAPRAMQSFGLNSFLKSYIRTCHKGVGWRWRLLIEDKDTYLRESHIKKVKIMKVEGLEVTTQKRCIFTYWGQVWHRSRHHYPPSCLFVHPSPSPPGIQRVKVYSGLGLQPYCLEPLGSWVHMPFLAGLRSPWRASPAPDPHSAEGALQFLLCQKAHHLHLYPCGPFFPWRQVKHFPLWASPAFSEQDLYGWTVDQKTANAPPRAELSWAKGAVWHSYKMRWWQAVCHSPTSICLFSKYQITYQTEVQGGHTTTNTPVSKHQQDVSDDIENLLQHADYSYLNRRFGRSDCIAPLIYFDCIRTTPVV